MPGFRETILANSDSLRDLRDIVTATQAFCTTLADEVSSLEEFYDDRIRLIEERLLARISEMEAVFGVMAREWTNRGR